jgi:hypothetical protein
MKNLLALGFVLFGLSNSQAGTLVNKATGESISFISTAEVIMDASKTVGGQLRTIQKSELQLVKQKDQDTVLKILLPDFIQTVSELKFNRIYKTFDEEGALIRRDLLNLPPLEGEVILK